MSLGAHRKSGFPARGPRFFGLRHQNRVVMMPAGTLTIGRRDSCDLVIDDKLVSREHARIIISEQSAAIEDLGSANGVLVNGRLIQGLQRLSAGDQIDIGHQVIEVIGFRDRTRVLNDEEPEATSVNLDHIARPSAQRVDDRAPAIPRAILSKTGRIKRSPP
jgi:pSer/pThr/pTyr-binding forkhead associated (FHA) protein